MKMKAVRYYAPLDIRYEEVNVKEPAEGEVVVKVEAALTCGTDVKTLRRGHPLLIKEVPSGFGHEFSGTIFKLGDGVEGFNVGDRVVAANSAPCGECFFCRRGEENLCENLYLLNGAYAQYITIPRLIVEKNLIKIPDRNPLKLKAAKDFAQADEIIDLKKYPDPKEIILGLTPEGRGLDVAVECVGLPEIWEQMFGLVRRGGTVHLFGGCSSGTTVNIDTRRIHYDEVNVVSVFHHTPKYFREALDLIASGQVDVEKLITKTMQMKYAKKALEMHQNGDAIKILLEN